MSNEEQTSNQASQMDVKLTIHAMQQMFQSLEVVMDGIRDRMDRQDELIADIQGRRPNRNNRPRRDAPRRQLSDEDVYGRGGESEGEEDYGSEFEVGRNRPRGVRQGRGYGRNVGRGGDGLDRDLGSIEMKIPSFKGRNDAEAYLEWERKVGDTSQQTEQADSISLGVPTGPITRARAKRL